ncbi:MAG: minichromosome maintenance protein MCM [Nanoarchaeota archaeon]|nr:minichromosome maintenance protein MCM [Nanoarchaeota archaeon]
MTNAQEQIEKFQKFLEDNYQREIHSLVKQGAKYILIDFNNLAMFDPVLAEELLTEPEDAIRSAEIALAQFDIPDKYIKVRFNNLPESQVINIKNIRSEHINRFICFEGIVRQSSDVRPQMVSAKFECPSCGNNITIPQFEEKFKEPNRCSCGRVGRFKLIDKTLVDSQRIIIEETTDTLQGGEQAKRLPVYLREDLVEPKMEKKTTPGSKVIVYGSVKEVPIPSKTGGQSTRFDLCMEANYIEPIETIYEEIELTEEDIVKIEELSKDPRIYEKFTASIAPSILGHEDIKGALILQLMGGVRKITGDGQKIRGDIHVLLVGDPGAAKSSLIKFIETVAPRARYVVGRAATSAGITAAVVKDEFMRGWALEAGAIVLASSGFLLLDEMDKMSEEDTSAMHEAMAQQTVTISKANIQATLTAQTSVLSAANPKLGRFDPYQPIAAQIDLPPALINRFDLIFPVRDIPNKEKDGQIATHVLELQHSPLSKEPPIGSELMKKYIAHAKQKINPQLTAGAIEEIKNFYVNLRNSSVSGDPDAVKPIPISARQLESLVRLAEGSARIRLSTKVERRDARKAILIMKYCLMQVGFDHETGQIDIDRISSGVTASTRNKIHTVREIINLFESKGKKSIPMEDIIAEATEKKISESQVEEIIEKLKREGEVYEPRRGFISKI